MKWNRREVAATSAVCTVAFIGTIAMLTGMSEPPPTDQKVALSEPIPTPTASSTPASNWRDGYVPCATPTGNTMTVGCYVDGDQPYIVTDDGETFLIDDATGARTYLESVDPPAPDADGTVHYSDGSWHAADGTHGCTPGAACDLLPPVPEGEPMTPNGGYYPTLSLRPCPIEDADNCYWDAARFGNHEGTSFIRLDGVTYYPEGK